MFNLFFFSFSVITVPADALAPLGTRAFAGTVMIMFRNLKENIITVPADGLAPLDVPVLHKYVWHLNVGLAISPCPTAQGK